MFRSAFFAAALFLSSAAQADVSGRYIDDKGAVILVEADDSGAIRIGPQDGSTYSIFTAEGDYLVWNEEGGTRVARFSDFQAVIEEQVAAILGEFAPEPNEEPAEPSTLLQAAGAETVAGRQGTLYRADGEDEGVVLSDDPALKPLGRAWARAVLLMPDMGRMISGKPAPMMLEMAAALEEKAPLRFGDAELVSVSFERLPEERFRLPGPPLSREEIATMLARDEGSGD